MPVYTWSYFPSMQNNKKKLLTDLAEEEAKREKQVMDIQKLKDKERETLFSSLASGKINASRRKNFNFRGAEILARIWRFHFCAARSLLLPLFQWNGLLSLWNLVVPGILLGTPSIERKQEDPPKSGTNERPLENSSPITFPAENQTDALITELMASNARHSDPKKFLEDMEKERREMEETFTIKAGEAEKLRGQVRSRFAVQKIRKLESFVGFFQEVLKEMQRMMEEELRREQVRSQYEQGKNTIINSALSE